MQGGSDRFVTIAITVSRVEAVVLASMLRGYRFLVHVSGDAHASVEVNSLALGGRRLMVLECDYVAASDILREVSLDDSQSTTPAVRNAVLRIASFWVGINGPWLVIGVRTGMMSIWATILFALNMAIIPVNPQGRADFYLADVPNI